MSEPGSALDYFRDPRISAYATGANAAWLLNSDATKILWTNAAGAALLGASAPASAAGQSIVQPVLAQIANVAAPLSPDAPPRLARLRGFAVGVGQALTCTCARITMPGRASAILVVAIEPAGPSMTLDERLRRLLDGCDAPIAFFALNGQLLHATPAATARLNGATSLAAYGADALAGQALAGGHASAGDLALARLGTDDMVLMATFNEKMPTAAAPPAAAAAAAPVAATQSTAIEREPPLRFVWQMDADGRFTLGSNEFSEAIGPHTATALGRPWPEIAAALALDPEARIRRAFERGETFSAVTLAWPADDTNERIAVEMSGFPVFDHERQFGGYRGFALCRDAAHLSALASARRSTLISPAPKPPQPVPPPEPKPEAQAAPPVAPEKPGAAPERPTLTVVPPSKNVVPFRASTPAEKAPGLSAVERRAFHEIARELTSRLGISGIKTPPLAGIEAAPPQAPTEPAAEWTVERTPPSAPPPSGAPEATPAILDRLPVGVLVYRHNQLIYANHAFLDWTGYESLDVLATAGGLERLFAEPGLDMLPETGAKSLAITSRGGERLPVEGRLFAIPWDRETALALVLMLAPPPEDDRQKSTELALRRAEAETRELIAILDTATDGVIVLDREGHVLAGNRSAEALFGYDSHELTGLSFADLFAPESERTALDYLDGLTRTGVASILNDGREVIGRVRQGGLIPLFMTMGRLGDGSEKLCAVFRDITQWKKAEEELVNAKRAAERTSSAKSEFLAKISHEIRTPLNSIIGFSEVMMEERFGPIGNERYKQYLKDIHSSGAHLVSLLNDLLDLSKIEAGKLELNFARVDLNAEVQQSVALMQPQANRERTIIRTSLAPALPNIVADARSVRQIVLNLLSNSIKFTGAGGQVIVSTTLNEKGEVVLRVRDTGIGMTEQDIAIALEPFRQLATSTRWGSSGTGLGLPLTKALTEANRANFSITSRPNAGTLVEISFPSTRVLAE